MRLCPDVENDVPRIRQLCPVLAPENALSESASVLWQGASTFEREDDGSVSTDCDFEEAFHQLVGKHRVGIVANQVGAHQVVVLPPINQTSI